MPTFTYVASTQSTARVFNFWDGANNSNDPGPDFLAASYDDSAWPISSAPDATNNGGNLGLGRIFPFGQTSEYAPTEPCAPWVTPPDDSAGFVLRCHFDAPASPYVPYLLEVYMAGFLVGNVQHLAINGEDIGPVFFQSWKAVPTYLTSGSNVIAMSTTAGPTTTIWPSTPAMEGWLAWRMTYYIPDPISKVWAWGTVTSSVNDKGVLGIGDTATYLVPTAVSGLPIDGASKVVSNGKTTLVLTRDGEVYGCGDNSGGMALGNGSTDTDPHPSFTQITSLHFGRTSIPSDRGMNYAGIRDIAIGGDAAIAVDRGGQLIVWGPNASGAASGGSTPVLTPGMPAETAFINAGTRVSSGKNFSAAIGSGAADAFGGRPIACGDNTYGQLGRGTSGTTGELWDAVDTTFFPATYTCVDVSAGDDQLIMEITETSFFGASNYYMGCGRGEYGSLGGARNGASNDWFYVMGTGASKINATPRRSWQQTAVPTQPWPRFQTCGPMLLALLNQSFIGDNNDNAGIMWGDGVPVGGAADSSAPDRIGVAANTAIYGKGTYVGNDYSDLETDAFFTSLRPIRHLAHYSGVQNPYAAGTSKAVGAVIMDDGTLYTWGYGGYGQMGDGFTTVTNLVPANVNGLEDVLYAEVAFQVMFAIATTVLPVVTARGRSFAMVIG